MQIARRPHDFQVWTLCADPGSLHLDPVPGRGCSHGSPGMLEGHRRSPGCIRLPAGNHRGRKWLPQGLDGQDWAVSVAPSPPSHGDISRGFSRGWTVTCLPVSCIEKLPHRAACTPPRRLAGPWGLCSQHGPAEPFGGASHGPPQSRTTASVHYGGGARPGACGGIRSRVCWFDPRCP